jgi:hypothetical protein
VVEQDAAAGEHAVRFPIVHSDPVAEQFGHRVRISRIKWRILVLGNGASPTIELGCGRLIKFDFFAGISDRLEQVKRSDPRHMRGCNRLLERHAHKTLRRQIVDVIWGCLVEQSRTCARVDEIEFDQLEGRMLEDAELLEPPEID